MEIVYHVGLVCTDEGQLLKSLLRNTERLAEHGVAIPGPGKYRDIMRDVTSKYPGARMSSESQEAILETILDDDTPTRLVFSSDLFLSGANRAYGEGQLYPRAYRAGWLRNIFTDHEVSFHFGIRNPASFLPTLWKKVTKGNTPFPDFVGQVDPRTLLWSDMIERVREAAPDAQLHVWCNEDSPLIWGELMLDIAGLDPMANLHGGFDMLRAIMSAEGMKRLRAYTKANPPANEIMRRRIASAFLDKFGLDEEIEEEIDAPGWSADLIEEMTAIYEDDLLTIESLPNVTLIAP